jgi:hypothetical protein
LMILGLVGEYLGRMYLGHTRTPQYIVRYATRASPSGRDGAVTRGLDRTFGR